jgi:hypothetical protein
MQTLYQTLEDRLNIDYVEGNGPFECIRDDAWLGKGYYYWDTFIENAHLWGEKIYKKLNKDYIICLSKISFDTGNLYDLTRSETLLEFNTIRKKLEETYKDKTITVRIVLEQIKNAKNFTYKAIKAESREDLRDNKNCNILFNDRYKAFLNTRPHYQVCLIDKNLIGSNNFKVVYPTEYSDNYTI